MASRRKTPGRTGRVPAISLDRLMRGWSGPNGTEIRMLADGQAEGWLELVETSGAADGFGGEAAGRTGPSRGDFGE
ncbi:hypothetical protein [Streptosporangium sandarakinum]|uniref:hypothetical protein n=1 Tax=Streptosporangium sandarakinum TaxID=1260955 RepID=UPI00371657ED